MTAEVPQLEARPPAIDTQTIRGDYQDGWLIWDKDGKLEEMKRSLTPVLAERAASPEYISLIRETARQQLAEFLRGWVEVAGYEVRYVDVSFADEVERTEHGRG